MEKKLRFKDFGKIRRSINSKKKRFGCKHLSSLDQETYGFVKTYSYSSLSWDELRNVTSYGIWGSRKKNQDDLIIIGEILNKGGKPMANSWVKTHIVKDKNKRIDEIIEIYKKQDTRGVIRKKYSEISIGQGKILESIQFILNQGLQYKTVVQDHSSPSIKLFQIIKGVEMECEHCYYDKQVRKGFSEAKNRLEIEIELSQPLVIPPNNEHRYVNVQIDFEKDAQPYVVSQYRTRIFVFNKTPTAPLTQLVLSE